MPQKYDFLPNTNYWLTLWSRVLLEKLAGFQLAKKFLAFYWIRWFITAFTNVLQLSLSCGISNQDRDSWRTLVNAIIKQISCTGCNTINTVNIGVIWLMIFVGAEWTICVWKFDLRISLFETWGRIA